jgi:hypothetical protein
MSLREKGLLEVTINKAKQDIQETQQIVYDDESKIIPNFILGCFL